MQGSELAELTIFLAVAQLRSFSKAAVERGIAPSAVSHAIRKLELRVGVRLFHRTTRSVALTDAGERFLNDLKPAFSQIGQALDGLNAFRDTPFGTVRINLPNSIAPFVLHGVMGPLLAKNPGLRLDIVATDRLIDIVEEGFDAGIRFGERLMQEMVAVRIKSNFRFAVVGSPDYLKGRQLPLTPADLKQHDCIRYRFPSGAILNWRFDQGGEVLEVEVDGPLTLDGQELMVEAALQACGLAYVLENRVAHHLESGALIRCLDDWSGQYDGLYLYYPSQRQVSAGLKALINVLKVSH
ncbi:MULTISPECIES: LysR family transcriptional regulator [Comamonas]|uniref:LysR family transcriptional regulator n=1 Tax=Comamonas TaxID=283 RepID=UPI0005532C37|nr:MULTISPECIES: LysR family transcriptional regulator [Comamonas]MPT09141.1 LysR family transcriptional regulator [Comamonas sp.]